MRIVSRTTRSILEQKRESSMRKRQAAGTLEGTFPRVEQVRIQLHFLNTNGYAPAAQSHALYPSAQAYFEFACPHGDCDGSIDLNSIALTCLKSEGAQADGTMSCPGTCAHAPVTSNWAPWYPHWMRSPTTRPIDSGTKR